MNPTNPASPLSPFSLTNPSQPLSPLNPAVNGTLYDNQPPVPHASQAQPLREQRATLGEHDAVGVQVLVVMSAVLLVGIAIRIVSLTRE